MSEFTGGGLGAITAGVVFISGEVDDIYSKKSSIDEI